MIVRILGEGQYDLADSHLDRLNELDARLQAAADADDEAGFVAALADLLTEVRALGTPVADDVLVASALVLPAEGTALAEVGAMLTDEGLIPG